MVLGSCTRWWNVPPLSYFPSPPSFFKLYVLLWDSISWVQSWPRVDPVAKRGLNLWLQLSQINYCQMNYCMLHTLSKLMCVHACVAECAHMSSCVWAGGQPPQVLYTFYFSFLFFWNRALISIELAKQALQILLSCLSVSGVRKKCPRGFWIWKTKPKETQNPSVLKIHHRSPACKASTSPKEAPSTPS